MARSRADRELASRSSARPTCTRRSRSRRWRPSSSASSPKATSGSTSRSGTASAGSSRTAPASSGSGRGTRGRCCATSPSCGRSRSSCRRISALDGEIVIERDGVLDFDAMQMRLHPAESRVNRLSARDPRALHRLRRPRLEGRRGLARAAVEAPHARSSGARSASSSRPATRDRDEALGWLDRFEAIGLDGVIAKRRDLAYLPGSRDGVVKVKPEKTADCVVVGVRWKSKPDRIATLLLGLYGDDGRDRLRRLGGRRARAPRRDRGARLPLLENAPERRFSEPNRWGGGELEESPVRPEARRRGALRQGAVEPLPPRHEAHPLPRRQGRRRSARGASCGRPSARRTPSRRCSGSSASRRRP